MICIKYAGFLGDVVVEDAYRTFPIGSSMNIKRKLKTFRI